MKRRSPRPAPRGPVNVAARALGSKIFGLKVVTPKKAYSRKLKHRGGGPGEPPRPLVEDESG